MGVLSNSSQQGSNSVSIQFQSGNRRSVRHRPRTKIPPLILVGIACWLGENGPAGMTMNTSVSSNDRVSALLSFLNARASRSFVTAEVDALFQDEPRVAEALDRVADLALRGHECVLGVDELETYILPQLLCSSRPDMSSCRMVSTAAPLNVNSQVRVKFGIPFDRRFH